MSKLAWMPLYVADYLGDTNHLSTLEHGAYLLLIMHYWQTGGLPTAFEPLARITRLSVGEFEAISETISAFFDANWTHKRIDEERAKAAKVFKNRSKAGRENAKQRQASSKPMANHAETHSQPHTQKKKEEVPLPSKEGNGRNGADDDPWKRVYDYGKDVLGKSSGGVIKQLVKLLKNDPDRVMAKLEEAAKMDEPLKWITALLHQTGGLGAKTAKVTWEEVEAFAKTFLNGAATQMCHSYKLALPDRPAAVLARFKEAAAMKPPAGEIWLNDWLWDKAQGVGIQVGRRN